MMSTDPCMMRSTDHIGMSIRTHRVVHGSRRYPASFFFGGGGWGETFFIVNFRPGLHGDQGQQNPKQKRSKERKEKKDHKEKSPEPSIPVPVAPACEPEREEVAVDESSPSASVPEGSESEKEPAPSTKPNVAAPKPSAKPNAERPTEPVLPPGDLSKDKGHKDSVSKESKDTGKKNSKYCDVCKQNVGGGDAGWWQHSRSPKHYATALWNVRDKNGLTWEECREKGDELSERAWAAAGKGSSRPSRSAASVAPDRGRTRPPSRSRHSQRPRSQSSFPDAWGGDTRSKDRTKRRRKDSSVTSTAALHGWSLPPGKKSLGCLRFFSLVSQSPLAKYRKYNHQYIYIYYESPCACREWIYRQHFFFPGAMVYMPASVLLFKESRGLGRVYSWLPFFWPGAREWPLIPLRRSQCPPIPLRRWQCPLIPLRVKCVWSFPRRNELSGFFASDLWQMIGNFWLWLCAWQLARCKTLRRKEICGHSGAWCAWALLTCMGSIAAASARRWPSL